MQADDLSMTGEFIFTEDDIKALSTIPGVKNVVVSSSMGMGIRYRDKESDTTVNAINEGYIEVNQLEVSKKEEC